VQEIPLPLAGITSRKIPGGRKKGSKNRKKKKKRINKTISEKNGREDTVDMVWSTRQPEKGCKREVEQEKPK